MENALYRVFFGVQLVVICIVRVGGWPGWTQFYEVWDCAVFLVFSQLPFSDDDDKKHDDDQADTSKTARKNIDPHIASDRRKCQCRRRF